MNRWSHQPTTKTFALLAAVALAIAPVDLLAVCGCAAAAEEALDCCCTVSCEQATPPLSGCCQPAAAPTSEGCSCSKAVSESPVGTLPVPAKAPDQQAPAMPIALLPPVVEIDSALYPALSQYLPNWPVPARILLCVWRN